MMSKAFFKETIVAVFSSAWSYTFVFSKYHTNESFMEQSIWKCYLVVGGSSLLS